MFNDRQRPRTYFRTGAWITLAVALAIGVAACGPGNSTQAGTTAAAVSPDAQSAVPGAPQSAPTVAPAAATTAPPATAAPTAAHAPAPVVTTANKATTPPPAPTNAPKPTVAPPPVVTAPTPTTPALPARRQPTPAEVNGVIASVHALFPLLTPTAAQITKVGNDVCTAFDQGQTVAQVKATAMQMAGAYAVLIPATVADSAVRTIVTLFCPGYTSKLG
jgi:hypothetical protein